MKYLTFFVTAVVLMVIMVAPVAAKGRTVPPTNPRAVVLDAGHGGSEPGACYLTLCEKDVTLDIVYRTKSLLEADGYTVYLTRTDDSTLSNADRYNSANSTDASVLVSVHLNGSTDHSRDGTMALYGKMNKDKILADMMHSTMLTGLAPINDDGVTNFASGVLLKTNMPATIVETVFISSDYENALLTDGRGARQQQIAVSLRNGVEQFLNR